MTELKNNFGWRCHAPTITELMAKAIRGHLDCEKPDAVLNIETHLFNVQLIADSCEYKLDVGKELWLNKQRWSRLIKEYVPLEALDRFISQACEILDGSARDGATANMLFRDPARYEKKHRWGGCLMGATFRGNGKKAGDPCLTLYSRTTYMGYMALLDAAIASNIARAISDRVTFGNGKVKIGFRWYISSQQLHCFKTLPYIYSQPDLMRIVENTRDGGTISPTWKHVCKWYQKVLEHYLAWGVEMLDHEKYGPFKRIKRRWLEHKGYLAKHVPPSLLADELDFSKAE